MPHSKTSARASRSPAPTSGHWYAAHVILHVRFLQGRQSQYPVWENVYLVCARGPKDAQRRAETIARKLTATTDPSFSWDGRPAQWVFSGIRKLVAVDHVSSSGVLGNGDELTYSEFTVPNKAQLRRLVAGRRASLSYDA
jgi:hypothetical protein